MITHDTVSTLQHLLMHHYFLTTDQLSCQLSLATKIEN